MASQRLYKITFLNQGQVYEVYAKRVSQAGSSASSRSRASCSGRRRGSSSIRPRSASRGSSRA